MFENGENIGLFYSRAYSTYVTVDCRFNYSLFFPLCCAVCFQRPIKAIEYYFKRNILNCPRVAYKLHGCDWTSLKTITLETQFHGLQALVGQLIPLANHFIHHLYVVLLFEVISTYPWHETWQNVSAPSITTPFPKKRGVPYSWFNMAIKFLHGELSIGIFKGETLKNRGQPETSSFEMNAVQYIGVLQSLLSF